MHRLDINALRGTVNEQDRQCTYKRKIEAGLRNHRCGGKAISGQHYECFGFLPKLLGIQN